MARYPKRKRRDSGAIEAEKARGIEPTAKRGKNLTAKESGSNKSFEYVVSIDFGTTFSGVAFAKLGDLESKSINPSDAIHVLKNWPGQGEAGARTYCKTLTGVWYMPGPKPETFELKGWGWTGYVDYKEMLQNEGFRMAEITQPPTLEQHQDNLELLASSSRVSARCLDKRSQKCGHFLTTFKLGLEGVPQNLPDGLTLERVISDYLRELSTYSLQELRKTYGKDFGSMHGSHRDIQYVLTVPAMWTPRARATMKECAEMAGIVGGPSCKNNATASLPNSLKMVTEPEAAAVHVHKTLKTAQFPDGERFLVVDVGGGTTDIVLHEKIGSTASGNIRVKEVAVSKGGLVGGSHVDEQFRSFLRKAIGSCFTKFEHCNPHDILEINRWWNDIKSGFGGSIERHFSVPIPGKLATSWKRFHRANGLRRRPSAYHSLKLNSSDVKGIFEAVVARILDLIRSQLVPGLSTIFVVGGFSESPYLRKKIGEAFKAKTIFMPNAGSAVLRGAVLCGGGQEWGAMITSRISSRTIGYDTAKVFNPRKHKKEYMVIDQDDPKREVFCDNIFKVIISRGQEVPFGHIHTEIFYPLHREGKEDSELIELNIYETRAKNPKYVTSRGVRKLSTCHICIPKSLNIEPKLQLSVHFDTLMEASVQGKNFDGKTVTLPPVRMKWSAAPDATETDKAIVLCPQSYQ